MVNVQLIAKAKTYGLFSPIRAITRADRFLPDYMTWFIVPPLQQNLFMLLVIALSSSALATERESCFCILSTSGDDSTICTVSHVERD